MLAIMTTLEIVVMMDQDKLLTKWVTVLISAVTEIP